jgi:hypothetical protein
MTIHIALESTIHIAGIRSWSAGYNCCENQHEFYFVRPLLTRWRRRGT